MSGPFKLKYKRSDFPFKTEGKEIKDTIVTDVETGKVLNKEILDSARQRRGVFAPNESIKLPPTFQELKHNEATEEMYDKGNIV